MSLIEKIKKESLTGRSGSCFPTHLKWEQLKNRDGEKYLVCNAAEGEPGVHKDKYLIENHLDEVLEGIDATMAFLNISKGFFYIKKKYHNLFKDQLEEKLRDKNLEICLKEDRYVAGEETAAINSIEGNRAEPVQKPPHPTTSGINGKPTLVHNIETLYTIGKINNDSYDKKRLFHLAGDIENGGIFFLPEEMNISEILKETDNYPDFEFIAQIGGGAGGIFVKKDNLSIPCQGVGFIKIFKKDQFDFISKLEELSEFFIKGNCDKCTPCREGIYRINEMIKKDSFDIVILKEIIFALEKSSYCPLGEVAARTFKSLIEINEN